MQLIIDGHLLVEGLHIEGKIDKIRWTLPADTYGRYVLPCTADVKLCFSMQKPDLRLLCSENWELDGNCISFCHVLP